MFDQFVTQRTRSEFQIATVLVPAMMATLVHLEQDKFDGGISNETNWGRSIGDLIERFNVSGLSALEQVQAILQDPIARAIEAEYNLEDSDQ